VPGEPGELGARIGAEHDRAVIDEMVDRIDLRGVVDDETHPPHRGVRQQPPALLIAQLFDPGVLTAVHWASFRNYVDMLAPPGIVAPRANDGLPGDLAVT
jgi:hypothetical protein